MSWSDIARRALPRPLLDAGAETAQRATGVVGLTALGAGLLVLAGTVSTIARGPNPLGMVLLAAALLSPGALATLRLPLQPVARRVDAAAAYLLLVLFAGVGVVAWIGYGPASPVVASLGLFPVVGLVLGGRRLGMASTAMCVGLIVALVAAERLGHHFPMEASDPKLVWMVATVHAVSLPVLFAFLAAYDRAWRRAADEAAAHAAEVERASEAQGRFLARMSHELRTPLNAIIGYTELVLEEASPGQIDDLSRVRRSGAHLLQLVDEILNLEKIGSGQLELRPEVVDLAPLLDHVVDEARPLCREGVVLRHDALAATWAEVDPLRVRQVLLNLVSNACKFTEAGTIDVSLTRADGGGLRIDVRDTGTGMDAEELRRVFDPFHQGTAGAQAAARGQQGTGLGLAISRSLAELMGGRLDARSTAGEGSCFRLHLPASVLCPPPSER